MVGSLDIIHLINKLMKLPDIISLVKNFPKQKFLLNDKTICEFRLVNDNLYLLSDDPDWNGDSGGRNKKYKYSWIILPGEIEEINKLELLDVSLKKINQKFQKLDKKKYAD